MPDMSHTSPLPPRAPAPLCPIVVGIATTGRPAILTQTLHYMAGLRDMPSRVILSIASPDDLEHEHLTDLPFELTVVQGPKGLSAQRNLAMAATAPDDILVFLDDDFLICDGFLAAAAQLFTQAPDIMVATGTVRADGILGPGLAHHEAGDLLSAPLPTAETLTPTNNAYGCNMILRMAPVHAHGLEFDTELPFYSWLEDVDFSRQLARFGRVVKSSRLQGVHLGTKTGRSRGVPLGYSQIANPVYLCRKGTMNWSHALKLMSRNFAANLARSARPEPWVDRLGRLRGNLIAARELLTGRLHPTRVRGL